MKKRLLFLICVFLIGVGSYANDTLTRAQIYNFNVGDTFEYRITREDIDIGMPLTTSYIRRVLMQKIFSANLDTIYFGYAPPGSSVLEWETVTDLDSFAILQIPSLGPGCNMLYSFDTTTYAGYASNGLEIWCFESGADYRYTRSLGRTFYRTARIGNIGYGTVATTRELTYYSNGIIQVGTPYIPPAPFPIHYVPLPETCAVWTRTVYGSYSGYPPYDTITEQIRTGNHIHKDGKTYVELICRIQNNVANRFTPDSLIGYFYNDSATLSARFVTDTNAIPIMLCSFTGQPGQQCSYNGTFSLDSFLLDGVYRTVWFCSGTWDCNDAKISGIGKLSGLIAVNQLYNFQGRPTCGSLTSFCECGQKLYPANSASNCDLISGVPQPEIPDSQFIIYPNPATNQLFIESNGMPISEVNIYNTTGSLVSQTKQLLNTYISVSQLVDGVYMAEIKTKETSVRVRWVKM